MWDPFDLDRDGKKGAIERALEFMVIEDIFSEESEDDDSWDSSEYEYDSDSGKYDWREFCEDGSEYDVDPENYETEDEYEEALQEAKYGWRDTCEDGFEYDIDPEDYETEEEYEEALEEAKYGWRDTCAIDFDYGTDPDDYETEEEYLEAIEAAREEAAYDEEYDEEDDNTPVRGIPLGYIPEAYDEDDDEDTSEVPKKEDYPNIRKYEAADALDSAKRGYYDYLEPEEKQAQIDRCHFILDTKDCLAADYLTAEGEFLFVLAIKEHFPMPFAVPDKDGGRTSLLGETLERWNRVDGAKAAEVWLWCIDTFYPYKQYSEDKEAVLIDLFYRLDDVSPAFLDVVLAALKKQPERAKLFMTACEESVYAFRTLVRYALEKGETDLAVRMFRAYLFGPAAVYQDICDVIGDLITDCCNYNELETAELFKIHFLPHLMQMENVEIQASLKGWRTELDTYIDYVERKNERYAYSRRFAWRKTCQDGSAYRVDPLRFETEEAYNQAIENAKYSWRLGYTSDIRNLGIDPADYESHEAYLSVRKAVSEQKRAERQKLQRASVQAQAQLAEEDKNIYIYCGVNFANNPKVFHYRTTDETLAIGDTVIVPVGPKNTDQIAEIVSVGKYLRKAAPFPVENTKEIKGRCEAKEE